MFVRFTAFLSADRLQQLQLSEFEAERKAAVAALEAVRGRHPSRSLLERLIADDAAWRTVYDEWEKLVNTKAKWEDLAATLATDGTDKVKSELRDEYGVTVGAAAALVRVIAANVVIGACFCLCRLEVFLMFVFFLDIQIPPAW